MTGGPIIQNTVFYRQEIEKNSQSKINASVLVGTIWKSRLTLLNLYVTCYCYS